MPSSIEGVKHKLERADEHFAAFETEAARFFECKPYAVDSHDDPSAGIVWTVTRAQDPPLRLAAVLGDGFHNLRAALDHLAWGLVEAGGRKPSWRTQFPILRSRKHFNAKVGQSLEGASSAAVDAVRALEPWHGGNHALHRLHHLDIADKHRLLLTVGAFIRDSYLPPGVPKQPHRIFPIGVGDVVLTVPAQYGVLHGVRFGFGITLGTDALVHGEPVTTTIHVVRSACHGAVEKLEQFL